MAESSGPRVDELLRDVLEEVDDVAFAIVFGSSARGTAHEKSDLDVAVQLVGARPALPRELGALVSRLEAATGRCVDVVDLGRSPPGLSYRVFRDGRVLLVRDREALVARKARAILEYLDYEPVERMCADAVLDRHAP